MPVAVLSTIFKMVSLDNSVIVRLKTHGENFEIFVDPDLALKYRDGEKIGIDQILAVEGIFKDAKAGDKASEELMKKIFGTNEIYNVADKILKKGKLHLTVEQRRHLMEERKRQIISIISRNSINPQTKTPHPPSRIEKAMDEAKVSVDISKSAKEQVDKIVKAIRHILPIKFETLDIAVKIPAQYSGRCYKTLREFGDVKKEEWEKNSLMCLLRIPGGLQDEFYSKLNSLTHGEVKIKVLR